jgi:hypothetical protein
LALCSSELYQIHAYCGKTIVSHVYLKVFPPFFIQIVSILEELPNGRTEVRCMRRRKNLNKDTIRT